MDITVIITKDMTIMKGMLEIEPTVLSNYL